MSHLYRISLMLLLLVASLASGGCFKETSMAILEEVELFGASALSLSSLQESVHIQGDPQRNEESKALIHTEVKVDTYSLLGMAKPDDYLPLVHVTPQQQDGTLVLTTEIGRRSLWNRLLVRVVPQVTRRMEVPTTIRSTVNVRVGDVTASNLPGDLRIHVDAGHILVAPAGEIYGEQRYAIGLGDLEMALPTYTGFRYNLQTDLGTISTHDVALNLQNRFLGARASGVAGLPVRRGNVDGKVRFGSILVSSE
ncbi:MAG: hypothetical protein GX130_10890 [Candidatus Hydrogenedens sp.]|jgi:hypothetical protein|nr:hypothetical protein [Candidatus Hydrogenedens sp.]